VVKVPCNREIKEYFPKEDFQSCIIHKVRNTMNKVKAKDRKRAARDVKKVYQASIEELRSSRRNVG